MKSHTASKSRVSPLWEEMTWLFDIQDYKVAVL